MSQWHILFLLFCHDQKYTSRIYSGLFSEVLILNTVSELSSGICVLNSLASNYYDLP